MKNVWKHFGRVAFWGGIPFLYIYLRSRRRTRVLIISEGMALLVKPWLGVGRWMCPGGGRHLGETAAVGAVREVQEETGVIIVPSKLKHVGEAKFRRYGLRYTYDQFVVELPAIMPATPQRLEILETAWVPLEKINEDNSESDVVQLLDAWRELH